MTLQYAAKDQQFINLRDPVAGKAPDADSLKAALRTLGGGVSVITAGEGEARTGATVTSATALSVDPPEFLSRSIAPRPHGRSCSVSVISP